MKKFAAIIFIAALTATGVFAQTITQDALGDQGNPGAAYPGRSSQQQNTYVRPSQKERINRYVGRTIGPSALIGAGIGATFQQIGNKPEEWEKTGKGFARRFGSNLAENAIEETVAFGIEEAFKLDSKYYKSKKKDFGSRLGNAFVSTFTARNKNGKRVFGFPRIAGSYTAKIISNETWYPKRYSYKDGLREGTQSLGFNIVANIFREFFSK